MIYINPQWQGSGLTKELKVGAETLKRYYKDYYELIEVSLSDKELTTIDNIKCFHPIIEQTIFFKNLISDSQPKKISTIGGDCGIEIIPVSYLNKIYHQEISVIWLDSHADLNTPESSPSKTYHGMPLRTLLGDGNRQFNELLFSSLQPEQLCLVGIRDLDIPEREFISSKKIKTLSNCDFSQIQAAINGFKKVYIHLDLDVLGKSEFEHTMFPSKNGLKVTDVTQLIINLKESYDVIGFCITESTASNLGQLKPIAPILDQIGL